jgi:FKBP-type peptidyl-prolyl cis-trans isomerase SlyD
MSGAVLGALYLLTTLTRLDGGQPVQALTLKPASVVEDGSIVSIEYTLRDDSGNIIDTNVGKEPLTFIEGAGQVVKGLERELNGMKVGDQKQVHVKPEDGYGFPDKNAFHEIPREKIPPEGQKPGAMLMTKAPGGGTIPMRVQEVKEKTVIVDLNHPLAGKNLNFDVRIKDIKAAEAK